MIDPIKLLRLPISFQSPVRARTLWSEKWSFVKLFRTKVDTLSN